MISKSKNKMDFFTKIFRDGFDSWIFMVKLIVPALIITRLLLYFELISYLDPFLRPIMSLLDLPPEMSLVWLSSMLGNLYVGLSVYISVVPNIESLTILQASIIGGMCLLAHGLIIEGQICRGTGLSFWRVSLFRIFSAILFGFLTKVISNSIGWGDQPAVVNFMGAGSDSMPTWGEWILSSIWQLIFILFLVEILMFFMALVKYIGIPRLIVRLLGPPLKLAGVGSSAIMVTIIGCVMGLTYGGGLIVAESKLGYISQNDIYSSMMLMAVFHSIFEDTFLMWTMGGTLAWLLGARLVFALLLSALLNRLARRKFWQPILVGPNLKITN